MLFLTKHEFSSHFLRSNSIFRRYFRRHLCEYPKWSRTPVYSLILFSHEVINSKTYIRFVICDEHAHTYTSDHCSSSLTFGYGVLKKIWNNFLSKTSVFWRIKPETLKNILKQIIHDRSRKKRNHTHVDMGSCSRNILLGFILIMTDFISIYKPNNSNLKTHTHIWIRIWNGVHKRNLTLGFLGFWCTNLIWFSCFRLKTHTETHFKIKVCSFSKMDFRYGFL